MRSLLTCSAAISAMMLAMAANAAPEEGSIAPVPAAPSQERITPSDDQDAGMLSTRKTPAAQAAPAAPALPWQNSGEPAAPVVAAPGTQVTPFGAYQPKIPFGRGEAANSGPAIPSGPHTSVAVPVVGVDAVESSEAAPPTPVAAQADPAAEDPQEPTELTSPIFGEGGEILPPKKILLRLLNKVTAQAQILTFKPNETLKVGQLEITAITCQTSSPTSQTDYAGLLDIFERSLTDQKPKSLFRGWMYASSPSITALEHPVYDVTMVECVTAIPLKKEEKKEEKPEEKPAKKAKN